MEAITLHNYIESRLSQELEAWRRHHELICRLVRHIDLCFGGILFVTLIYTFCGAMKYTTQLFNLERGRWFDYYFILAEIYSRLFTILVGSHLMQYEVLDIIGYISFYFPKLSNSDA